MSQMSVSRPGTQASLTARLPEIQHPLSRLQNPEMLGVRGVSRAGDRPGSHLSIGGPLSASYGGRPLGNEKRYDSVRRSLPSSCGGRIPSRASLRDAHLPPPPVIEAIPEGVVVTQGDPTKTRMPIFGNRADMASRTGLESRASSRLSQASQASAQNRLEIDELESILRERVRNNYYEIKKKFKDADPEQKGNVSRDAFFRIVLTTLNRPLNQSQYGRLMERLGFKDKQLIHFSEFYSQFREVHSAENPRWMDPVQRNQDKSTMSSTQVHMQLKEKARQRVRDIADLIPQTNPDGAGYILKPEFRNVLNQMGFIMDDDEFEKLWAKYDTDGIGTINGEKMMRKLGVTLEKDGSIKAPSPAPSDGKRILRKKELERQRSLNMENWLKAKFREGFQSLKVGFEAHDPHRNGTIDTDGFLRVLKEQGLTLDRAHLSEFLARSSLDVGAKGMVPYREFLHRFQDRSEGGMAHQILTNPKHKYNRAESLGGKTTFSSLEAQLLNMFQRDFLALLGTFHKIDKLGMDIISQEEFRAAIESRFDLEVSNDQFETLLDRVPMDDEGNIKYADFMAQFDTKGRAKSLFGQSVAEKPIKRTGALPENDIPSPPASPVPSPPAVLPTVDPIDPNMLSEDAPIGRRSTKELFRLIKELLRQKYQDVEDTFYNMDESNTRRLSQESMFQLLKKFDFEPSISRGEIRDIWRTFITNQDKTLDFLQFTRHFGYSLRSAAFPNAKVMPPRRGDSDFLMRSRKLNCAADMLQDNLRSKIDYMWEDLRKEFISMDPYGTGFVSAEEFHDVLNELCVHLSDYEIEMLTKKFEIKNDHRVSYIEFLKPFAMRRQTWRHGNNMLSLLQHPQPELPLADIVEPPHKGLTGVTAKLRQKLAGDWKNLRRAFKKMDVRNAGLLSIPEFRSVLKLANIILSEEEMYHVLSQFDEDMSGKLNYHKFLSETFQPEGHEHGGSLLRKSAMM